MGNFSEAVISLYARGLTTREIESHVKEIYGVEISPQFVSWVTEELQQQIVEWPGALALCLSTPVQVSVTSTRGFLLQVALLLSLLRSRPANRNIENP